MIEKVYSRNEVLKKTLEYFKGDELASNVWINKYALKDSQGNVYEESPVDMHHRLASEIARIEKNYPNPLTEQEIFDVIKDFKYIVPQGGPMSGIGNTKQIVSLSNCFVIGNDHDSYGSIMLTDQEQVQLMKRRGGVGHDLSHLRPNASAVKNSALTSTGLVSFMERYSNSTREVGQDGRRGALMLSCSIKHPDVERFMDAKMTEGKVTGANVSIRITDDFMKSVIDNKTYSQQFPIGSKTPEITKDVDAKPIFDKIIYNAWKSAEPGILFWDTIQRESIPDCYPNFKTTSTNPCLVGNTWIKTNIGNLTIQDIYENYDKYKNENLLILSYNIEKTVLEYKEIDTAWLTRKNANVIELVFETIGEFVDGTTDFIKIKVTPDHKCYTENRGWVEASNITMDDVLLELKDPRILIKSFVINNSKINKTKLKSINVVDNEDVYDIEVRDNHNFFANQILVHNCGEIPLCPYDSCRLLALNLYSYVINPFTKDAKFDFELFAKHSRFAQRIMDDIIDLELEKIQQILAKIETDPEPDHIKLVEIELWTKIGQMAENGRRTGIGITAEGDMIAALGLRYGTPEATEFAVKIHKALAIEVYKGSCYLAKERGSFKVFDAELEKDNVLIKRLAESDPELKQLLKEGRRNIALLTIAPTGCLVKDTKIKTDKGVITLENLFLLNGIDINLLNEEKDIWFELENEINVFDVNGNKNRITKLYWNGYDKTKKLTYSDNSTTESTNKHMWLVKIDEENAVWKRTDELKISDKIIKIIV